MTHSLQILGLKDSRRIPAGARLPASSHAMHPTQALSSLDLPELLPYRTLRLQENHRQAGLFVAEGEKVVLRLLDSPLEIVSLLVPNRWLAEYRPLLDRHTQPFQIFVAERDLLETLTGFHLYQGVLALARVPPQPTLPNLLAQTAGAPFLVALEDISNAENVGVVVRNSSALGAHALITGESSASPWLRRAVRSSMGAVFRLPILESPALLNTLAQLRDRGVSCVAAHPAATATPLSKSLLTGPTCIVLGSEGHGLSPATLNACSAHIAIPMQRGVDSLNVASAAAVFFYELNRQRGLA